MNKVKAITKEWRRSPDDHNDNMFREYERLGWERACRKIHNALKEKGIIVNVFFPFEG